jgi:hypothetical protein
MRPQDAEVDQHFRHRFRHHGPTPISVDRVGLHDVAVDGGCEEVPGHDSVFRASDQPAGDITGEDVDDDVALVPDPFGGSFQRGDVPRPDLRRAGREKFRAYPRRMCGQTASFTGCPAARAMRYIVDTEHQYRPSSSSRAHTCGIARSVYVGELSSSRIRARSLALSVCGGGVRGSHGPCTGPNRLAWR